MKNDKQILRRENKTTGKVVVECKVLGSDNDSRIFWMSQGNTNTFALKFKCNDTFYYQHLVWSCRGGKKSYYPALVKMYRYLVAEGLAELGSLRCLADGGPIMELRLNGTAIKRGSDTLVEAIFHKVTDGEAGSVELENRRDHWRNALGVPRWDGKLEVYQLRSSRRKVPVMTPRFQMELEDSRPLMDTEAIRRVEHAEKYGPGLWSSTAAAVLRSRFGTDDTVLLRKLYSQAALTDSLAKPPGTRQAWIREMVALEKAKENLDLTTLLSIIGIPFAAEFGGRHA